MLRRRCSTGRWIEATGIEADWPSDAKTDLSCPRGIRLVIALTGFLDLSKVYPMK